MQGRWGGKRGSFNFFIRTAYDRVNLSALKEVISKEDYLENVKTIEDIQYTDFGGIHDLYATTQFSKKVIGTPPGQVEYTTPGTYYWTAPAGVTSVCVVCIGGGGGGMYYNTSSNSYTFAMGGGAGGGLGWKNNIPVTPGQSYQVTVGAGGLTGAYSSGSTAGGISFFISTTTVAGFGGSAGRYNTNLVGGSWAGDGGGIGGGVIKTSSSTYGPAGGGGAGGYNGNGGDGRDNGTSTGNSAVNGSGGGAGGGSARLSSTFVDHVSGGGGGVGIYGIGPTGTGRADGRGASGSYGQDGGSPLNGGGGTTINGGAFGGGGGGASSIYWGTGGLGGGGAVRIIWGAGRAFPGTNTSDM